MLPQKKNPDDLTVSQRHEMERLIPTRDDIDCVQCSVCLETSPFIDIDDGREAVLFGDFLRDHLIRCHHRPDLAEYW